jgi:hypothetical protein
MAGQKGVKLLMFTVLVAVKRPGSRSGAQASESPLKPGRFGVPPSYSEERLLMTEHKAFETRLLRFVAVAVLLSMVVGVLCFTSRAEAVTYYDATTLYSYRWRDNHTIFRVGPAISSRGADWVTAVRKSAAKWSNGSNADVATYGLTPLPTNFYYEFALYTDQSQQFLNTVSISNLTGDYSGYIAYAFMQADDGAAMYPPIYSGQDWWFVRLDIDEPWSINTPYSPAYSTCFHSVVCHELGHILGLFHPSPYYEFEWEGIPIAQWPTMVDYYATNEIFQRTISSYDVAGVYALYGF